MATRARPGDVGAADARRIRLEIGQEFRSTRQTLGLSLAAVGRRAGVSGTQVGRIERGAIGEPTVDQLCRVARALGLKASLKLYPDGAPVRDAGQLPLLDRLEHVLPDGMPLRREVVLPIAGDQRAWDARIRADGRTASIDAEARLGDIQAVSRRVALKQRDDPDAGVVILLVNRTDRNRRVLNEHREALREQFPLDGAAILRHLRAGRIPPAGGILLL